MHPSSGSPSAPLRQVFAPFALALVGVVLGGVVADRCVGWFENSSARSDAALFQRDAELGWTNRPEFSDAEQRLDSLGLRNPEIPPDAPTDEVRVLVAGDSYVYGMGVQDGETWRPHLEEALDERYGAPVRVLNAGVQGYSLVQVCRFARRMISELEPDIVLVFAAPGRQTLLDTSPAISWVQVGEITVPAHLLARWPKALHWIPARMHRLLTHSAIYLRHRAQARLGGRERIPYTHFVLSRAPRLPVVERRLQVTHAEVSALVEECARRGITLRFIVLHDHYASNEEGWRSYLQSNRTAGVPPLDTPWEEPLEVLAEFLESAGAATWNFLPVISYFGQDPQAHFLPEIMHWSPAAHRLMALALERELFEERLVEQARQARAQRPRARERAR